KLVPLPEGKTAIRTKWILKNKRDARGIVVRNKARLVAQDHRQEEGIDYDEILSSCYGIHCCCWSAQVQVIAAVFVAVSILKLTLPTGRYVVPTGRVIATDSVIVATSGYVVPAAYDISPGRVK
ncbi:copia protein, partial [Tanacetum coccineum]